MIGKIALFLLFILFIWGNLVAGLHAGLGCPDWPLHVRLTGTNPDFTDQDVLKLDG